MAKKKDTLIEEAKKIKAELDELKKKIKKQTTPSKEKIIKENRTCKEICKKFKVKKPSTGSRYGSGQGRCQTCDVWIDYKGAHMKDGSPAVIDSVGWFCNCCNYRIRQKPRNRVIKEKLKDETANLRFGTKEENVLVNKIEKKLTSENSSDWIKAAKEIRKEQGFTKCNDCKKNNHCLGNSFRCDCECPIVRIGNKKLKKKKVPVKKEKQDKKIEKIFELDNSNESKKENEGNIEFFKGVNDTKNDVKNEYNIENECEILIENYKKRTGFSEHNIGLMEDMIDAYNQIGSLRKLCQEAELDISIIRRDFRNLSRVPMELRELVIDNKLISDPILATEIAVYATDYFEWDQEKSKSKDVITLSKNMALIFKNNLNLRREFFATKDDYDKPVSTSAKKIRN